MTTYTDFFSGAATVAGALAGLLFVALSVSPGRLRGDTASVEHQAIAATAFTALADALFVSLIGLQPGGGLRYGAVILGGTFIIAAYAAQVVTGLTVSTGAWLRRPRRSSTSCSAPASPLL